MSTDLFNSIGIRPAAASLLPGHARRVNQKHGLLIPHATPGGMHDRRFVLTSDQSGDGREVYEPNTLPVPYIIARRRSPGLGLAQGGGTYGVGIGAGQRRRR